MSKDILLVLSNPVEGAEDEFNRWYDEHIRQIADLDGFTSAQRYKVLDGYHRAEPVYRYLTIYNVADGKLEEAAASISAGSAERAEAIQAGRDPRIPISTALSEDRITCWFASIADTAAGAGPTE
jgi:hypothetical protein